MPMLMLKGKTCGDVFPGIYVPEGSSDAIKSAAITANLLHVRPRATKIGMIRQIIWTGHR